MLPAASRYPDPEASRWLVLLRAECSRPDAEAHFPVVASTAQARSYEGADPTTTVMSSVRARNSRYRQAMSVVYAKDGVTLKYSHDPCSKLVGSTQLGQPAKFFWPDYLFCALADRLLY